MQERFSTDEKLELAAERGLFRTVVRISGSRKLGDLINEGLQVDMKGSNYYMISWDNAIVDELPKRWSTESIFKERPSLSQAQRLWLISVENS